MTTPTIDGLRLLLALFVVILFRTVTPTVATASDAAPASGAHRVGDTAFAVDVFVFETGVEPRLRMLASAGGKPVAPEEVKAEVTVQRLGRPPQRFSFSPVAGFLEATATLEEPHSFDIRVDASWRGHHAQGEWETLEARVDIPRQAFERNALTTFVVGERALERTLRLTGRVGIPAGRLVEVRPRYAGLVREAFGRVGEKVRRGQALAVVESDAGLAPFPVPSPLDGVILARTAVAGAAVDEVDVLHVVANLDEVTADFDVYGEDVALVRPGESLAVRDEGSGAGAEGSIDYVSPLRDVHTQTTLARATLDNRDGRWSPGAFLTATLALEEEPAAMAVPVSSLQSWRGKEAVFVVVGDVQEARPVTVGRRGEAFVEILGGLEAGDVVAAGNTFLLRAEIEKEGASHDH